jgi:hypothetical protein
MVGATPAAAAAIVNGCCTLMATNPTAATHADAIEERNGTNMGKNEATSASQVLTTRL